jgi:ABC-type dipeptide/oligopeptide/nickel transport system ATPase subunit
MFLEANDIRKTYRTRQGTFIALDDANLQVDEGEIVGLIGTSGSGKSTMASILIGLETADSGYISLQGFSCAASMRPSQRMPEYRKAMAGMQMVFQNPTSTFSERMKVGEGIAEGIAYRGVPKSEHAQCVKQALDEVGLPSSYADKYAWELSGGECQRAAIARAIISRPQMLICDEPTSALDVTIQAQIVHLIARLCRERNMACLFISHDLALVRGLCSRVYVIDAGKIVEEGRTSDVLELPQSDAAKRLVNSIIEI